MRSLNNFDYDYTDTIYTEWNIEDYAITLKRIDFEDDMKITYFRTFNKKTNQVSYLYTVERLDFEKRAWITQSEGNKNNELSTNN